MDGVWSTSTLGTAQHHHGAALAILGFFSSLYSCSFLIMAAQVVTRRADQSVMKLAWNSPHQGRDRNSALSCHSVGSHRASIYRHLSIDVTEHLLRWQTWRSSIYPHVGLIINIVIGFNPFFSLTCLLSLSKLTTGLQILVPGCGMWKT